jgi:predicted dehydrogenase
LQAILESNADLVVVNTPVGTHFEFANKYSIGQTCHCRKAFTTVAEAKELATIAKENR